MTNHILSIKNQSVKLSAVDFTDDTYRISTAGINDQLIASIKSVGLLNPPIIIENNSGFTIVCGFQRFEVCRLLKWNNIPARILDSKTDKLTCAQLAITDNALQRPLNLIEKSRVINLLARFLNNDNELAITLSALGLPESLSLIPKIKRLCLISADIQKAIQSNTITLPIALKLEKLEATAACGFVELFEHLRPSLNKQREILVLVEEISHREDISMHQVLTADRLQEIMHDGHLDKNQKTRMIRQYLRKRRFPTLTEAEQNFSLLLKELNIGKNIRLTPPQNFEGTTYTLTLYFKNLDEFKNTKTIIDSIIQNPAFEKILNRTQSDH